MADFNPSPRDRLTIGGLAYQVMPHPAVPSFAFGQEGRKAFVFQLSGGPDQGLYALKKFKEAFRLPELVEINNQLARFAQWPGLEVCNRECLHNARHADILSQYPDLEFAVLMPWIGGSTWYDMVIGMTPLTRHEALAYADAVAQVLAQLEEARLAHCDISAANVIINPNTDRAHLIDVEDLYAPGFDAPAARPAGTDGYAHREVKSGYWGPYADRFSGAVIISEMAAWHVPEIRKQAEEEHYFAVDEMHQDTPHYRLMRDVLADISPRLAEIFDAAWFSDTLADAPPLKDWHEVVREAFQRENVARVAPEWRAIGLPATAPEGAPTAQPAQQPRPIQPEPTQPEPAQQAEQTPASSPASPAPAPAAQPAVKPAAAQQSPPPPGPVGTAPSPAQPAPPQRLPATGGPVVEWRPLAVPQPPEEQSSPAQWPGGSRPIIVPSQPAPEPDPEPEPEPPPAAEAEPAVEAEDEPAVTEPIEQEADTLPEVDPAPQDAYVAEQTDEAEAPVEDFWPEEEAILEAQADEDLWPVEDPIGEIAYEDAYVEAVDSAYARQSGLLKPLLDLTHIDERNRPHLVWTESPAAEVYILEEDSNPNFDSPKAYTVRAGGDTRWSPPLWPLWRRSGRLYYRLRAEAGDEAGPWSDILQVRIGRG